MTTVTAVMAAAPIPRRGGPTGSGRARFHDDVLALAERRLVLGQRAPRAPQLALDEHVADRRDVRRTTPTRPISPSPPPFGAGANRERLAPPMNTSAMRGGDRHDQRERERDAAARGADREHAGDGESATPATPRTPYETTCASATSSEAPSTNSTTISAVMSLRSY